MFVIFPISFFVSEHFVEFFHILLFSFNSFFFSFGFPVLEKCEKTPRKVLKIFQKFFSFFVGFCEIFDFILLCHNIENRSPSFAVLGNKIKFPLQRRSRQLFFPYLFHVYVDSLNSKLVDPVLLLLLTPLAKEIFSLLINFYLNFY